MKQILLILLLLAIPSAYAIDDFEDPEIFGLEVEKLLNLGSGLLALGLFGLTLIALRKRHSSKLGFVVVAFLLFAVKSLLMSTELFFDEWAFVDITTALLDFAILIVFFLGVMKK